MREEDRTRGAWRRLPQKRFKLRQKQDASGEESIAPPKHFAEGIREWT
jgi:hypothetical protein